MAIQAGRTLLYRIINKLEGSNNSVPEALESLVDNPEFYDPLEIEKQLVQLGYNRCKHCHTLLLSSLLIFSGGEEICNECY